eukprot:gb/GECH01005370.1/.p1 GENE.gb/GECH01005370.1/~~gb/GECH01005370.1/.p1  ORF type:complete len:213 (+),score=41.92 gb/GECH01005370.1/:1-639(+)
MAAQSKNVVQKSWDWYLNQLKQNPILTKAISSAFLSAFADIFAQVLLEGKVKSLNIAGLRGMDFERMLKFTIFGLVSGCISHFWYLILDGVFNEKVTKNLRLTLPSGLDLNFTPWLKLIVDQLGFAPSINVFFFSFMALLDGKPHEIQNRLKSLWPTLKTSWKVWPLAQYFNFNFVPPHLRVLFSNMVAFFWSVYLAVVNNRSSNRSRKLKV